MITHRDYWTAEQIRDAIVATRSQLVVRRAAESPVLPPSLRSWALEQSLAELVFTWATYFPADFDEAMRARYLDRRAQDLWGHYTRIAELEFDVITAHAWRRRAHEGGNQDEWIAAMQAVHDAEVALLFATPSVSRARTADLTEDERPRDFICPDDVGGVFP